MWQMRGRILKVMLAVAAVTRSQPGKGPALQPEQAVLSGDACKYGFCNLLYLYVLSGLVLLPSVVNAQIVSRAHALNPAGSIS